MSDASQPYEKNARFKAASAKGGGNLPPPFADSKEVHSTRDNASRVDHIEHVLDMATDGATQ